MWSNSVPTLNPYEATKESLKQETSQIAKDTTSKKNS